MEQAKGYVDGIATIDASSIRSFPEYPSAIGQMNGWKQRTGKRIHRKSGKEKNTPYTKQNRDSAKWKQLCGRSAKR